MTTARQVLSSLMASASLISSGMNLGYSATALPLLDLQNEDDESWFASIASVTTPVGCLVAGPLLDFLGRRYTLTAVNAPFLLGWLVLCLTPDASYLWLLYIGRVLTGLGTGMVAIPATVYIAEMSTCRMRPMLLTWPPIAISVGILIVYLLGWQLQNWRLVAGVSIVAPVITSTVVFVCLHESPVWLLGSGRDQDAESSFRWVRGIAPDQQLSDTLRQEFDAIRSTALRGATGLTNRKTKLADGVDIPVDHRAELNTSLKNSELPVGVNDSTPKNTEHSTQVTNTFLVDSQHPAWEDSPMSEHPAGVDCEITDDSCHHGRLAMFARPEVWKPLLILNLYFFFMQMSGVYVVIFYAVDIIRTVVDDIDAFEGSVYLGILQLIASFAGSYALNRCGRRLMSLFSGLLMTFCMFGLGLYLELSTGSNLSFISLVLILIYIGATAAGFNTIPWAMLGELFPVRVTGVAGGLTTCLSYSFSFAATKLYPSFVHLLGGSGGVFFLYGAVSGIATIYLFFFLPETFGKTLQQIGDEFVSSHSGVHSCCCSKSLDFESA
ncbi:solute carrier family 2, facilitated glucose transporter member 8-like isoform X2 [Periplaneta americana]|uniref:solute carrier family 2, facilitated glucose transporter member 8-like isoform X2 n=1 Tax=Periplaneta americana TaxID=6978 RepID=UPI0037E8ACFA